jgi:hypothetical protein
VAPSALKGPEGPFTQLPLTDYLKITESISGQPDLAGLNCAPNPADWARSDVVSGRASPILLERVSGDVCDAADHLVSDLSSVDETQQFPGRHLETACRF